MITFFYLRFAVTHSTTCCMVHVLNLNLWSDLRNDCALSAGKGNGVNLHFLNYRKIIRRAFAVQTIPPGELFITQLSQRRLQSLPLAGCLLDIEQSKITLNTKNVGRTQSK